MPRAWWRNLARYLLIAVATLLIGIALNLAIGNRLAAPKFWNPSFYLLVAEYGTFHLIASSVAMILSAIFSTRVRSILYLSLSILGFLAATYVLSPSKYGGVHLFIIYWASLVLIALDYVWRVNGRRQNKGLASS